MTIHHSEALESTGFSKINLQGEGLAMRRSRMAKMSASVSKLTPKQEQAMLALLTNQGVDNAARAVGIAPRTLYRWMNEPLFDKAYRKARRDAFG